MGTYRNKDGALRVDARHTYFGGLAYGSAPFEVWRRLRGGD
jgi:hypothetical protein